MLWGAAYLWDEMLKAKYKNTIVSWPNFSGKGGWGPFKIAEHTVWPVPSCVISIGTLHEQAAGQENQCQLY